MGTHELKGLQIYHNMKSLHLTSHVSFRRLPCIVDWMMQTKMLYTPRSLITFSRLPNRLTRIFIKERKWTTWNGCYIIIQDTLLQVSFALLIYIVVSDTCEGWVVAHWMGMHDGDYSPTPFICLPTRQTRSTTQDNDERDMDCAIIPEVLFACRYFICVSTLERISLLIAKYLSCYSWKCCKHLYIKNCIFSVYIGVMRQNNNHKNHSLTLNKMKLFYGWTGPVPVPQTIIITCPFRGEVTNVLVCKFSNKKSPLICQSVSHSSSPNIPPANPLKEFTNMSLLEL